MHHLPQLTQKLKEIFQTDRADLDFGIYRILNSRADQINDYLNHKLPQKIRQSLSQANQGQMAQWQNELAEAEKQAQALGVEPDASPKVQQLQAQIAQAQQAGSQSEAAIFSHLYTFFSRYYDEGDFISQRRYKGDTYAIPYSGEEVLLHWANKDQYYTKSGENFSNYRFKLSDGREVFFRLIAADTAKDNRKDNDDKRLFVLAEPRMIEKQGEDGEIYEEMLDTVVQSEDGKTLEIRFEYCVNNKNQDVQKDQDNPEKDKSINGETVQILLSHPLIQKHWQILAELKPTEKSPVRTLLRKHLSDYTQKNTADYFIHKDLGGFLRRELDFYIKNEVMHLDNIQHADSFEQIKNSLRQIQVLREIAHDIITFLAQLEDFQKKLWLKKKFVAQTHYLITLDKIPAEMLPETLANPAQQAQWKNLFNINELVRVGGGNLDEQNLKKFQQNQPHLVVDTSLYPPRYQQKLLTLLTETVDLDANTDGVLIHSDNFQALNLLQARYREQVKCIYIDPPYNTDSSAIIYKNGYRHSSWLALIESRLFLGKQLLNYQFSSHAVAIDEAEQELLGQLLNIVFYDWKKACLAIQHNPRGKQGKNISYSHEYLYLNYPNDNEKFIADVDKDEIDSRNLRDSGSESDRMDAKNCFYPFYVKEGKIIGFGEIPDDSFHPTSSNIVRDDGVIEVYPLNESGHEKKWRYARQSVNDIFDKLEAKQGRSSIQIIFNKDKGVMRSLWNSSKYDASEYGTKVLQNILGATEAEKFSYPKSINTVLDVIRAQVEKDQSALILDYFAGSGTTAHAVINLNREDGGNRKYILVEQGEYFDTVLKPRVQKVIYSENWKNGKPMPSEKQSDGFNGVSQIVKVLKLESYEDTLNNLELKGQADFIGGLPESVQEDYLLRYLLDVESKGSLLNSDDFTHPFDYCLNIATDSAGAYAKTNIDLVETFNYLLGLRVRHITDEREKRGYVMVEGALPNGDRCLIVWRDVEKMGYTEVAEFFNSQNITPNRDQYDVVYLNGDHYMANLWQNEDGTESRLSLRAIEPEFLRLMFA
ncbi:site-specific DNA-methyltransferase [Avibacterium paragallinarum]|uniref:site-specific DNA-methyltransferase n=1 Tax=Avibacterium paragallinarum TaxID=728 RepID=UPI003979077B